MKRKPHEFPSTFQNEKRIPAWVIVLGIICIVVFTCSVLAFVGVNARMHDQEARDRNAIIELTRQPYILEKP